MKEKRISLTAGIVWNSVGNFLYLFAQWLLTYVVVRTLGYESAGVFSLSIAITTGLFGIASYSMRSYQSSDVSASHSTLVYIRSRYLTCAAFFLVTIVFTIGNAYTPYVTACVAVYAIFKTTEALSDVYQGELQLRDRLDLVGISFGLKGILEFAIFSASILLFGDLLIALTALTAVSLVLVLALDRTFVYRDRRFAHPCLKDIRSLLIACLPLACYGVFFNLAGQLPRYFIESQLGAEMLGYYTSVAMPTVVIQVSASFLFSPLVTPLARQLEQGDLIGFRQLIRKTLIAIAGVSLGAFVGFLLLGDWLLLLLFGEPIRPYLFLLYPLILCTVLTALAWFLANVITVMRKLRALLVLSCASLAVSAFGSVPMIAAFGLNGASFALAMSLVVFIIGGAIIVTRYLLQARRSGGNADESSFRDLTSKRPR